MRWNVALLILSCLAVVPNWARDSRPVTIYERECNYSSQCSSHANFTQGPDVIWIPFFCNEKEVCACPQGWIPFLYANICVIQVTESSTSATNVAYMWGVGSLVIVLLAITTYSFAHLCSRTAYRLQLTKC